MLVKLALFPEPVGVLSLRSKCAPAAMATATARSVCGTHVVKCCKHHDGDTVFSEELHNAEILFQTL